MDWPGSWELILEEMLEGVLQPDPSQKSLSYACDYDHNLQCNFFIDEQ